MLINIGFIQKSIQIGLNRHFVWNTKKTPHILISGITGGGKTVLSQLIVNQLLDNNVEIILCDFKAGGDWDKIVNNYYEYLQCDEGVENFYTDFTENIKMKTKNSKEKFLVIDEFSTYALSKDTKDFKNLMSKISYIAFMGRSFGFHLILISQQFNSKVIDTAIREQFGIKIYMGTTISTESATMLFPNCDIDKSVHLPAFCGYISTPEKELDIIQLPYITKPEKLKKLLIKKGKRL